ncbi:hypothetical protein JZ751_019208 [Albula glossodonta]|uniref:Nuclear fragile X mental retardation-interacting protein 2 n=1 Tax=Albula glossodonta TaxID=121402 RepID=A0A8T2NQD9_9TELE|nr:hypothetical protein JZ751_019208 [Albula glossodonta]
MDSKNDKPSDFSTHEGKPLDKKDSLSLLNGLVSLGASHITNGYPCKPIPDNDGSGSENGYTTPKKRRASRNSLKGVENVSVPPEKTMQQGSTAPPRQGMGPPSPEPNTKLRPGAKADVSAGTGRAGEPQRKNSDGKASVASGKKFEDRPGKAKFAASSAATSVTAKEDSWTLFKPPPVFPVDNSSAKIVPKISYASKVKENLNKAAQAGSDALPPQESGRPSLVPMSALKTITSASFTNGPVSVSGEGNGCLPAGPLLSTAASTVPLIHPHQGGENVATSPDNDSSTTATPVAATGEPRKSSLFVYPTAPTNMQPALPSAHQVDTPPATTQTNQKALGDIFQNQWGLSFINEPNAGPDGGEGKAEPAGEMTLQGQRLKDCGTAPPLQERPPLPGAHKVERRTSPLPYSSVSKACPSAVSVGGGRAQTHSIGPDPPKGQTGSLSAIAFASSKDPSADPPQASLANPVVALVKEQSKGFNRRCSWGSFDLKAAVDYHTKDPKRVIIYDETKDRPDQ